MTLIAALNRSVIGLLMVLVVGVCGAAANDKPSDEDRKQVRGAASLVVQGQVYSLAVVTGPDSPAVGGRSFKMEVYDATGESGQPLGTNRLTGHDDKVATGNGIGTQIDGLAHVGIDGVHYGGIPAENIYAPDGVTHFGVETIKPIVTRGVLIDIAALKGVTVLPDAYEITRQDIMDAMARQKLTIHRGDVALVHTGWLGEAGEDAARFMATSPGLGKDAAEFLAGFDIVAIGADNWAIEVIPTQAKGEFFPVHQIFLARHGIYTLENIWTQTLAEDGVSEFMFVLAAPRLQGAVQGIVHPVAIR